MWNLQASSKIIQEKSLRKNFETHQSKLRNIKSVMKINAPEKPLFIYTRQKQQLTRREKLTQIDRQNDILLKKMINIKEDKPAYTKLRSQSQWLKSLNVKIMNNNKDRIEKQNKKMCDRLMLTRTHYSTANLLNSAYKQRQISINISQNSRRAKSARSICSRPQSAYSSATKGFANRQNNLFNNTQRKNSQVRRPESAPSNRLLVTNNNILRFLEAKQAKDSPNIYV